MLSSIYLQLNNNVSINKIYKVLKKSHKKNYFVRILPINKDLGTENVINTNFCEISICKLKEKNRVLILSAIDNLIKGAAGQAVQNMNIIFDFKKPRIKMRLLFFFLLFFLLLNILHRPIQLKKYLFVVTVNVKTKKFKNISITIYPSRFTL